MLDVVGCFLEYNDKFLILYRHSHKPDGNTWGLPSGKVELNENEDDAVIRELFEESGYQANHSELEKLGTYDFVSPTGVALKYTPYKVKIKQPHSVILEQSAHADYQWVTASEADAKPDLIFGLKDVLRFVGYIN